MFVQVGIFPITMFGAGESEVGFVCWVNGAEQFTNLGVTKKKKGVTFTGISNERFQIQYLSIILDGHDHHIFFLRLNTIFSCLQTIQKLQTNVQICNLNFWTYGMENKPQPVCSPLGQWICQWNWKMRKIQTEESTPRCFHSIVLTGPRVCVWQCLRSLSAPRKWKKKRVCSWFL